MARPIDADALVDKLRRSVEETRFEWMEQALRYRDKVIFAIDCISEAPTIDAAPVMRGGCEYCNGLKRIPYQETHSVKLYMNSFADARTIEVEANKCPPALGCGLSKIPIRAAFIINFCPHCGADMRGDADE